MGIMDLFKKRKSPFSVGTITSLNNNGNHGVSSGEHTPVLTDERLKRGDRVIIVTDNKGKKFILGGYKWDYSILKLKETLI